MLRIFLLVTALTAGPSRTVETVKNVETVAPAPTALDGFGHHVAIVTEAGGDATVAFTSMGSLYAARSDRSERTWLPPVKVAEVGDCARPFSLALDASNGLLAIAFVDRAHDVRVATSKDTGVSWIIERLMPGRDPSLAMAFGRAYLTWVDEAGGHYATGRPDELETWHPMPVPARVGKGDLAPVVGVDSRGEPGVVWLDGAPLDVFFWRPTAPAMTAVHTHASGGSWDLALAFERARPRIALRGTVDGAYGVWMIAAADAGRTWGPAVRIPDDGTHVPTGPVGLALSAHGKMAITVATDDALGGEGACGWPKVSREDPEHVWSTCSPIPDMRIGNRSPAVAFDGEELMVAVTNADGMPGIYVWRSGLGVWSG
jgi:hypothetical protein